MARYIKVNPLVAKHLHLEGDRNTVKDGNYILWQGDMLAFGPLTQLAETLAQIGAIALMPHEAREEQDGTVIRPLPVAEDPRFVMPTIPKPETPEMAPGTGEESPQDPAESEGDETPSTPTDTIPETPTDTMPETPTEGDETTESITNNTNEEDE